MNPTHSTPSGPVTVDAEAAFLGCLMRSDAATARDLLSGMRPDDLGQPIAREVLALATGLATRGIAPNPAVLYAEARRTGRVDTEQRHVLLTDWLIDTYRAAADPVVGNYLKVAVLEAAYRRVLREHAHHVLARVDHADASELADLMDLDDRAIDIQSRLHRTTESESTRPITPGASNEPGTGDLRASTEAVQSSRKSSSGDRGVGRPGWTQRHSARLNGDRGEVA